MSTNNSDVWMMPPWISAAVTGPHPILIPPDKVPTRPTTRPRKSWQDGEVRVHPDGRPVTMKVVPAVERQQLAAELGRTKRGSPPPDLMRVASSVALLGALFVALGLQWVVGG